LSLTKNWQHRMEPPPQYARTTYASPENPRKMHNDA
jgi:hypothetical protein